MNENTLEFIVSLRGGDTAASEMARLRAEVSAAGGTIRRVGEQSSVATAGTGKLGGSIKRLAGAFIALGAGYKIYGAAKNAITFTKELAESSNALTHATGLNIETSSRYVSVAGALGISSGQLNLAFKSLASQAQKASVVTHGSTEVSEKNRLAKINETAALQALEKRVIKGKLTQAEYNLQVEKLHLSHRHAAAATGASQNAFAKLGITQEWLAKHGKDFNAVILEATKRLGAMPGGYEKTKIETELFGRSWAALNPLLGEGSDHLEHVLGVAKKFGVELHGGVNKELEQLREAQLESSLATDAMRIAFTKTAAGPMINLLKGFAQLKVAASKGEWGKFDQGLERAFTVAGHVVETFEVRSVEGFGQLAPKLLAALWHGFQRASLPNKALMLGVLATKFGLTGSAFSALGSHLGKKMGERLVGSVAAEAGTAAAGASVAGAFATVFVAALPAALAIAGVAAVFKALMSPPEKEVPFKPLSRSIGRSIETGKPIPHAFGPEKQTTTYTPDRSKLLERERVRELNARRAAEATRPVPKGGYVRHEEARPAHGAFGANVQRGGLMEVGERGPELLNVPAGASVTPLKPGSLAQPIENVLVVDGKVLARVMRRQALLSEAAGA